MNASAIKLSKVSKRYGKRRVLHDVSFEVDQSELCALVGANGAGKSTLIKIVLGLCEPSSGSVELFGGKSKKELSLMRTRVGYVPDSSGAYQSLSAAENLRIRCAEWGLDENCEIPRVLSLVGLDADEKKSVSSFSLGMKRRLDIATALLGDTDVLIFDEPANGLDPLGIESIWALIGRLNREQGKTMLISSHDLDELASVATSCLFIHDGELIKKESMDVIRDEASSLKEYYRRLVKVGLAMKRAIHPIKADMMRLHRIFPAKFGLALMLAFGLLFGIFLKNGTTLLVCGNSVFGEDIGFIWNVIDPSAPDESLVRSAFAGTSLFVPLIVCLVLLQEHGYKEGHRISSARGLNRFYGALAHAFSSALIIGAAYSALCLLLFAIAIIRGGHNYSHNILTVFLPAMIVNAVLVISVALETVTIYRITGSAVLSGAVVIVGFVMSLTLYGAFLQAPIPSLRWIFFLPGPYLGVGCALGYSDMGQLTLLGYGVAASCLSVLIYALLSFRAGGVLNGSSD